MRYPSLLLGKHIGQSSLSRSVPLAKLDVSGTGLGEAIENEVESMRSNLLKHCVSATAIALLALVPAVRAQQQIPAGTSISISLNESVSSKEARTGQKLDGIVASGVVVNGKTLVRKGAKANLSVASVRMAGPMAAPAMIWLQIDSIEVNKKKTVSVSASLAGQGEQPLAQRDGANRTGLEPGTLVANSTGSEGELVGASSRSDSGTSKGSTRSGRDIVLAAKTKLRFTLRDSLQLN